MVMHMSARHVDVRVVLAPWREMGRIVFEDEKLRFPELPWEPGVYRITLTGATLVRPRVYFGEGVLREPREGVPVPGGRNSNRGQKTNIDLHDQLRPHLDAGGTATIAISSAATVAFDGGDPALLDLWMKAGRLLAENAAIVAAIIVGEVEIINKTAVSRR